MAGAESGVWLFLTLVTLWGRSGYGEVVTVTWENFSEVQEGEWMLEFYAPWCPACQQFASTWQDFANRMEERVEEGRVNIGKADVTVETMLSGRFMVTQLPSIFHIRDGEVRVYSGGRILTDLLEYVDREKWKNEEPIPFWKSPTALHMYLIGTIFWLSEVARETQVTLEQDYEMPTYAIFILIALATIVFGLLLGGVTVCLIEICLRFCSRGETQKQPRPKEEKEGSPQPESSKGYEDVSKSGSGAKAGEGGGVRKRQGGTNK